MKQLVIGIVLGALIALCGAVFTRSDAPVARVAAPPPLADPSGPTSRFELGFLRTGHAQVRNQRGALVYLVRDLPTKYGRFTSLTRTVRRK